jgi:ferritin-like metal-binding protein YciE
METKYHCLHRGQRQDKSRTSMSTSRIAQMANEIRGDTRGIEVRNGAQMGASTILR